MTQQHILDVPQQVADAIMHRQARIIGIDGTDGVGKSTLAAKLASLLNGKAIDVDDHLNRKLDTYLEALRIDELAEAVRVARDTQRPLIVCGVCLREVMKRINLSPEIFVYVEFLSPAGLPTNSIITDYENGIEADLMNIGLSELDQEQARYHREFRPRRSADIVFQVR